MEDGAQIRCMVEVVKSTRPTPQTVQSLLKLNLLKVMKDVEAEAVERKLRQTLRNQAAITPLSDSQFEEIMSSLHVECYAPGDSIVNQQCERETGAALFVVINGEAKVSSS